MRSIFLYILGFSALVAMPAYAQHLELRADCMPNRIDPPAGGAAYVPGVDVNGNPVTLAGVENEKGEPLNYPIEVPITVDAIEWLGLDVLPDGKSGAVDGDAKIADIFLFEDGHVEYNGVNVSDHISVLCQGEATETHGTKTQKGDIEVDLLGQPQRAQGNAGGENSESSTPESAESAPR